jgi:methyl-accepting chemotaxis protein
MSQSIKAIVLRPDIQRRALIIAVVVGTLLNCINQLPDLMAGAPLQWIKAGLTYMVPYSVSLYSSVASLRNL